MSGTLPKFYRYRVKRGDSLWRIAEHAYGRGGLWEGISDANHLKRGRPILAGQELVIPTGRRPTHRTFQASTASPAGTQAPPPQHRAAQVQPIPLHHPSDTTKYAATRSGPFAPARPVLFPQFKYSLNGMVVEQVTPLADYKLSFTGEVTLQKEGVITGGLTFTKEGIETEYKKEANGVFEGLFSKSSAKVENGKAEVSLATGATLKSSSGQVLATTETSLVPPNGIKYSYKGPEIKGTYKGYEFTAVMGYELEIHLKPQAPKKSPEAHAERVTQWAKVAGIGLVALAAVIVVADVAKDIGTLGVGAAESPLSFAAAAELFGTGMAMVRVAAH
jgi:hypothetical protein